MGDDLCFYDLRHLSHRIEYSRFLLSGEQTKTPTMFNGRAKSIKTKMRKRENVNAVQRRSVCARALSWFRSSRGPMNDILFHTRVRSSGEIDIFQVEI